MELKIKTKIIKIFKLNARDYPITILFILCIFLLVGKKQISGWRVIKRIFFLSSFLLDDFMMFNINFSFFFLKTYDSNMTWLLEDFFLSYDKKR